MSGQLYHEETMTITYIDPIISWAYYCLIPWLYGYINTSGHPGLAKEQFVMASS